MQLVNNILSHLEAEVGQLEKIQNGYSYNSPCPVCGGDDRFGYTPNPKKHPETEKLGGLFYCRQCKYTGNGQKLLNDLKKGIDYSPGSGIKTTFTHHQHQKALKTQFSTPPDQWQQSFNAHLITVSNFLNEDTVLPLTERGISLETAKRFGICPISNRILHPAADQSAQGPKYGPGIFIPARRGTTLFKVELRNFDPDAQAKYIIMPGSSLHPMIFPDNTDGSGVVIIIESLLDGYMLHSQASDLITPIALGSTNTALDTEVIEHLKKAKRILVCLDNDQTGWARARTIKAQFPSSTVIIPPFGKDPGEYFQRGGDLRAWLGSVLDKTQTAARPPQPKIQINVCRNPENVPALLEQIRNASQPVSMSLKIGPIGFNSQSTSSIQSQEIKYMAFYFGDNQVIIFDMLKISLDEVSPVLNSEIVTYDGVAALSLLNKSKPRLKSIHSVQLMDNALRNNPIKPSTDLDSLANLVGVPPKSPAQNYQDEVKNLFRDAKLIYSLYIYLTTELAKANKTPLYNLMRNSQLALSQIRQTGFYYNKAKRNDPYKKFIDPITGRLPNNTQISGTITGRFTSATPSLHNVKKDETIRSRFVASQYCQFVMGDFNQIQLRIIAELSQDQALREVFANGQDLHLNTAAAISNLPLDQAHSHRTIAKAVNFGIVFGQTPNGLKTSLLEQGIETTIEQAKAYQETFYNLYPGVKTWIEQAVDSQTSKARWKAISPIGRVRDLGWYASHKKRELINTPVQAAESEILLATLGLLPAYLEQSRAIIVHTVHDEIIIECLDEDVEITKQALHEAMIKGVLTIFPNAPTNNLVDIKTSKTWWIKKD